MSLADLASLGSFVSGAAVLASLAFLYLQMRQTAALIKQTERNQRAAIRSERTYRTVDLVTALMAEPTAADAFYMGMAGTAEMTSTQIRQYALGSLARVFNAEDAFSQHAEGLLDESAFTNLTSAMRIALSSPGFRVAWRIYRAQFHGDFALFMDKLLSETEVAVVDDPFAQWRTGFEAERAKGSHSNR
jgi:hypothetical protein